MQGSKGFPVACRAACADLSGLSSCSQSGGKCVTPSETGPWPRCHCDTEPGVGKEGSFVPSCSAKCGEGGGWRDLQALLGSGSALPP